MGLIYVTVGAVANIMFKNMGMPNDQARVLVQSILGFPYTFKFLWAPLLELYKTKKFFVVLMQFAIAGRARRRRVRRCGCPGPPGLCPCWRSIAITAVLRRDAGHRHRRRLRDHAGAQGSGQVPRLPEHVLERRRAPRQRARSSSSAASLHDSTGSWPTAWMIVMLVAGRARVSGRPLSRRDAAAGREGASDRPRASATRWGRSARRSSPSSRRRTSSA